MIIFSLPSSLLPLPPANLGSNGAIQQEAEAGHLVPPGAGGADLPPGPCAGGKLPQGEPWTQQGKDRGLHWRQEEQCGAGDVCQVCGYVCLFVCLCVCLRVCIHMGIRSTYNAHLTHSSATGGGGGTGRQQQWYR